MSVSHNLLGFEAREIKGKPDTAAEELPAVVEFTSEVFSSLVLYGQQSNIISLRVIMGN